MPPALRKLAVASLVAGAAAIASDARADDASQARALFDEAGRLLDEGKVAQACPKLEESLRLFNGLGTRGRLAECYERSGRAALAWNTYRDVALRAKKSADPTREQVANQRAKALDAKVGKILVVLAPNRDVPGLVVRRNGAPIERDRLGGEVAVDPGLVELEASAPGRKPASGKVLVSLGQTMRYEVPELEREDAPRGAPAAPPPAAQPADDTPPPPAAPEPERAWQRPLGLGLAGAGLVAVGASVVFGLAAKSTYDGAFDDGLCQASTSTCTRAGQAEVDDARGQATVGTVFFVAGLALAGGGAALFFTAPPPGRRAASGLPGGVRVAPSVGRRDAGLVLEGRF